MQDRFAGDVGDFSKFALIRVLAKHLQSRAGLIWYLFPDETHTNDGRHIAYLNRAEWQRADADLILKIRQVVESGRSVSALEKAAVLSSSTSYFSEIVPARAVDRTKWFARARAAMLGCDLVFVDPDNGIAGPNHRIDSVKGGKHITEGEIRELANVHHCLGIYDHFDRSASHPEQIDRLKGKLSRVKPDSEVVCLRYRRVSPRAYFILSDRQIRHQVDAALAELTTTPWDYHFERY
jgi:hypothetical protein